MKSIRAHRWSVWCSKCGKVSVAAEHHLSPDDPKCPHCDPTYEPMYAHCTKPFSEGGVRVWRNYR